jgi:small-conductance mechanosensitive channel
MPNSALTKNQLINRIESNLASLFEVTVGVTYSSDVKLVMEILKEALDSQQHVLRQPYFFVRFTDFGDSLLNFLIIFWSEKLFRVENIKSEIKVRIFELFKNNNITIHFPQRVIHID